VPDDNVVIAGAGASFEMTIFRDVHARSKHEITIDLPELAERIRAKEAVAKEDLPLGSFAKFGGKVSEKGSLRHDANVLSSPASGSSTTPGRGASMML
jgi:hypothetical protein